MATTEEIQAQALREALMRPLRTCEWCGTEYSWDTKKCVVCCRTISRAPKQETDTVAELWEEIKKDAVELFQADPHIALEEGDQTNHMPRATIWVDDREFAVTGGSLHEALWGAHEDMLEYARKCGKGE